MLQLAHEVTAAQFADFPSPENLDDTPIRSILVLSLAVFLPRYAAPDRIRTRVRREGQCPAGLSDRGPHSRLFQTGESDVATLFASRLLAYRGDVGYAVRLAQPRSDRHEHQHR